MIIYEQTTAVHKGDYVWHRDDLYKAVQRMFSVPCTCQCAMYNIEKQRCNGFCYKFSNCGANTELVFKRITRQMLPDNVIIKETEFQKDCRLYNDKHTNTEENGN